MTIIEKLKDLHKQATTENSHFYVAKCCEEAIAEILRLQVAIKKASAKLLESARPYDDGCQILIKALES
jgi:hypothetical protein